MAVANDVIQLPGREIEDQQHLDLHPGCLLLEALRILR